MTGQLSNSREIYIEAIKSFILERVKKFLMAYCISKLPFLAFSWINPIFAIVVNKLVTVVLNESEMRIFFKYVDVRSNMQGSNFEKMALQYHNNRTKENEKAVNDALDIFISLNSI